MVEANKIYDYGGFQISPVSLYHDVPNFGFRVFMGGEKAIYAVDTGYIDDVEAKDYTLYLVEANHTEAEIQERIASKMATGEFDYETRAMNTHLSQEQATEWLVKNAGVNSKYIFLHEHQDKVKGETNYADLSLENGGD